MSLTASSHVDWHTTDSQVPCERLTRQVQTKAHSHLCRPAHSHLPHGIQSVWKIGQWKTGHCQWEGMPSMQTAISIGKSLSAHLMASSQCQGLPSLEPSHPISARSWANSSSSTPVSGAARLPLKPDASSEEGSTCECLGNSVGV